jgi:hypothetical protein
MRSIFLPAFSEMKYNVVGKSERRLNFKRLSDFSAKKMRSKKIKAKLFSLCLSAFVAKLILRSKTKTVALPHLAGQVVAINIF